MSPLTVLKWVVWVWLGLCSCGLSESAELRGVTVTPHVIAESMKYRRSRDPELAAKVQLFVKGGALPRLFDGKRPDELLASGEWAWHDMKTAVQGTDESLSVWIWNGKSSRWGTGDSLDVDGDGLLKTRVAIETPQQWISNITFPGRTGEVQPTEMIVHVVNNSARPFRLSSVRLWLPRTGATWQSLFAAEPFSIDVPFPAGNQSTHACGLLVPGTA